MYCAIDNALNAKAVAAGSNMPVALDPTVWLHRCRRCKAPFIALPRTRLCSDGCRALAKHDAAMRSKAKRAGRAVDERLSEAARSVSSALSAEAVDGVPLDQAVLFDQVPRCRAPGRASRRLRTDDRRRTRPRDRQRATDAGGAEGDRDRRSRPHAGLAERVIALQTERAKVA